MSVAAPIQPGTNFDLFRLTKSKREVDICSNTIRAYIRDGLPVYRMGKAAFISRAQLHQHITSKGRIAA